jgi:bacterioferritin-associated ferredoxin
MVMDDLASIEHQLRAVAKRVVDQPIEVGDLVGVLASAGKCRRLAHAITLAATRRAEEVRAHVGTGAKDTAAFVAGASGGDVTDARRDQRVAEQLQSLPLVDAAVRDGALGERAAADIAGVASKKPDAQQRLLDAAARGRGHLDNELRLVRSEGESEQDRADRQREARSLTMHTDTDGMLAGRFRLQPEHGAVLKALIDQRASQLWRGAGRDDTVQQRNADALVEMFTGKLSGKAKTTVNVVVDLAALQRGEVAEGERCDIPGVGSIPLAHAVEQLGSQAFVTLVVKNGVDIRTVSHMGRYIPKVLLTALVVAGRHECCVEGCTNCRVIQWDHHNDFAKGGATAIGNMGGICFDCHKLKTAGWTLAPPQPGTRKRALHPPGTRLDE